MQVTGILKAITQLSGGEATATVQLTGLGLLDTFHDGYRVSHAINRKLLTPGAQVVVDLVDIHHPGDGQLVSVAAVSTNADSGSAKEQFGTVSVLTDGSGNGAATVAFPNTFSSFGSAPAVSLSAQESQLGAGSASAGSITATNFAVTIAGAPPNSSVSVAWDATGT